MTDIPPGYKKVTIEIEFMVPQWANYIAGDEGGDWYVYQHEPVFKGAYWIAAKRDSVQREIPLTAFAGEVDWKSTLRKI